MCLIMKRKYPRAKKYIGQKKKKRKEQPEYQTQLKKQNKKTKNTLHRCILRLDLRHSLGDLKKKTEKKKTLKQRRRQNNTEGENKKKRIDLFVWPSLHHT